MNTFSIERGDNIIHGVFFATKDYEMPPITEMSFDEIVNYDDLPNIVDAMLDATDHAFGPGHEDVFVTLVDKNGVFIWSINIVQYDSHFEYSLINWEDSGYSFSYGVEND